MVSSDTITELEDRVLSQPRQNGARREKRSVLALRRGSVRAEGGEALGFGAPTVQGVLGGKDLIADVTPAESKIYGDDVG